jgi:D-methionine transport system substrate-binding protein
MMLTWFLAIHYLRLAKTIDPNDALILDDNTNTLYSILFVVRDDYQQHPEKGTT